MRRTFRTLSSLGALVGAVTVASPPVFAQTTGANGTHDPSRMIASNGKFYVFSTGGGSKSSTDGLAWTSGPALFPNGIPQSTASLVANDEGVWAPDVIYLNNQYYLYYALSDSANACAIGLITSPTLDPSSSDYKWTDRGPVVSNPAAAQETSANDIYTIDPSPLLDTSGNLWLSWGSGYTKPSTNNTIYVTRLDNMTGLPLAGTSVTAHPLEPGHIEASYIYYHTGYYYLFWNSGGCCSGASSTYEIHVARSAAITGPYGASQIFLASTSTAHGPGQIGIYDSCGASRFTYHYYPNTGGSVLGENALTWGSDGWPVVGPVSTTALQACSTASSGGGGSGGGNDVDGGGDASEGDAQSSSGGTDGSVPDAGGGTDDSSVADAGGSSSSGGTGGSSGSTSSSGSSTSSSGSSSGGGDASMSTPSSNSSCSCSLPGRAPATRAFQLLLIGAAAALVGARRRGRRTSLRSAR